MAPSVEAGMQRPTWRTVAYCLAPFAILLGLSFYAAFVLVPLLVFALVLARRGKLAGSVVWSLGVAAILSVALAGALAFPADHSEITDSGGAQVIGR